MSNPPYSFVFEVGGVEITYSFSPGDVDKILAWSTSEVILYLGSEGPLLQEGLRVLFDS